MYKKWRIGLITVITVFTFVSCFTTSYGSSDGGTPSMRNISFSPTAADERIQEEYEGYGSKVGRKNFDNLRSYSLEEYRTDGSLAALETLLWYQLQNNYVPEMAYVAARDLYRIDPDEYRRVFAETAYVRALTQDSSEGDEVLPLRAEAAMHAFRLIKNAGARSRLMEFLRSDPRTSFQGYVLALESEDSELADKLYTAAMKQSPLYLAAYLRNEGFPAEADQVEQALVDTEPVNSFHHYLQEDFNDGPSTYKEIDEDGILLQWEEGAWRFSNNRSPDGNFKRLSYTPQKKYDGWNFMSLDFTDISTDTEAAEYWVYYGNINIHINREKGYRIDSKPSHVYSDLLVYQDWTPLPEECGVGETFTMGIYPGEDEVLVQLGNTLIPLEGAFGKRYETLYIDLSPGSGCRIDNLNFYGMNSPVSTLGALPGKMYEEFEENVAGAAEEDLERWLNDPFMRSHHFAQMVERIALSHPDFSWSDYQRRAVDNLDFAFIQQLENYNQSASRAIDLLPDDEIRVLVHQNTERSVSDWTYGKKNEAGKEFLETLYGEYRTAPRWQRVIASNEWTYDCGFGFLQHLRTDLAGDSYKKGGLIQKDAYLKFIDDLFNLGEEDIMAAWESLTSDAPLEEQGRYAASLYSSEEQDYIVPFTARDDIFYFEYFGEKSKWPVHEMKSASDYQVKIQDDYPAEGYLLSNGDNGDDSYNYFYVYKDIFSHKGCSTSDDPGRWETLDVSLMSLEPAERNERGRVSYMGIKYNGVQLYLRDNGEFRVIYLEPFKNSNTVVQDWTPYPSGMPEGTRRTRVSMYTGMDKVMIFLNGEKFGPYPEMPARKQGNTTKSYGKQVTIYIWEDSSISIHSITARDSEFPVDKPWLTDIQNTAFDYLMEQDNDEERDWNALFRITNECYYTNRELFNSFRDRLAPHLADHAVPWFVMKDEWRVLEALYGGTEDAYRNLMKDTADFVRSRLNDAFNSDDAKNSVKYALDLFYNAYKDGYLFYDEVGQMLPRGVRATSIDFDTDVDTRMKIIRNIIARERDVFEDNYWVYHPWVDDEFYLMNLCGLADEN